MLRSFLWLLPLSLLFSCVVHTPLPSRPPRVATTVVTFHDTLSPWGEWLVVAHFGRVWRPYRAVVGIDFVPNSTGGRWLYTDHGWIFDTDWEWGAVTFHYGRWLWLGDEEGWGWVPDTVWGPSWVEWRYGAGYVGWVPLPPPGVTVVFTAYQPRWRFVEARHFPHGRHHRHLVPDHRASAVYEMSAPLPKPHASSAAGPPPGEVAGLAAVDLSPMRLEPPKPLAASAMELPRATPLRQVTLPRQVVSSKPREEPATRIEQPPRPPTRQDPPARPASPAPEIRRPVAPPTPLSPPAEERPEARKKKKKKEEEGPARLAPRPPGGKPKPVTPNTP